MRIKPKHLLAVIMLPKVLWRRAVRWLKSKLPPRYRCRLGIHQWHTHKHTTGFARRKCQVCYVMQEGRWYDKRFGRIFRPKPRKKQDTGTRLKANAE